MIAISVIAHPFLTFSNRTYHLESTGIGLASCTVLPDSKEIGSRVQEGSPSADKNTGVVLVPCCACKCVPTAISIGVDISEVPGCHLLRQMSSQ